MVVKVAGVLLRRKAWWLLWLVEQRPAKVRAKARTISVLGKDFYALKRADGGGKGITSEKNPQRKFKRERKRKK